MRMAARFCILTILTICTLTMAGQWAMAGECREATPAETAAARKLAQTFETVVVARIEAGGWKIAQRQSAAEPQRHVIVAVKPFPPSPEMLCYGLLRVDLVLDPNTAKGQEWKRSTDALQQQMEAEGQKVQAAMAAGKPPDAARLKAASHAFFESEAGGGVEVKGWENASTLAELGNPVQLPGTKYAWRTVAKPDSLVAQTATITVCTGDWSHAAHGGDFRYAHKTGTPYIENGCVSLRGAPAVVDALAQRIAWNEMEKGLTR